MRFWIHAGLISCVIGGAALSAAPQQTLLTGTISFRERIALPPTASVEVRLEDVTRADAPPAVVARTRIAGAGQIPVRFNLDVDMSHIDRRGRYALRATITDGVTVLFTSMDTMLVLTQGHGTRADLVLTRVGSAQPAATQQPAPPPPANLLSDLPATFVGTLPCAECEGIRYHLNLFGDDVFMLRTTRLGRNGATVDELGSWTLSSDRKIVVLKGRNDVPLLFELTGPGTLGRLSADGRAEAAGATLTRSSAFRPTDVRSPMRGAYAYMADAATFVECSTGRRWPVAAEGAGRDVEAAYLKARSASGAAVLAEIDGLLTERPRPEGGVAATLVIERFGRFIPKATCGPRFAGAPLTDTYWRLTHLGARAVTAATDPRREPALTFMADGTSFSGASGCNRLVGSYEADHVRMTLTSGGTMIACRDEARTEAAFIAAIKETRTYRILGRVLELHDVKGARIARFEARVPAGITVR